MKKWDNEFIGRILDLADEHFAREDDLSGLASTVAETWTEAEADARAAGTPINRENIRWAARRILFQPYLWPGVDPQQGAARRAALERLLGLCKGGK